jgi:hypothetical protein
VRRAPRAAGARRWTPPTATRCALPQRDRHAHGRIDLACTAPALQARCAPPPSTWTTRCATSRSTTSARCTCWTPCCRSCCAQRGGAHQPGQQRGGLPRAAQGAGLRPDQGGADQPGRDAVPRPAAHGIGVSVVNPGFVETPLTAQNDFRMPALITPRGGASAILRGWAAGDFEIHFPKRFTLLGEGRCATWPTAPTSRPCGARPGCEPGPARPTPRVARIVALFEALAPADLARWASSTPPTRASRTRSTRCRAWPRSAHLRAHVRDARRPALRGARRIVQGDQCFLTWDFRFRMRASPRPSRPCAAPRTCASGVRRPHRRAPRLLGRRRGAVREAAADGRADALAEARVRA